MDATVKPWGHKPWVKRTFGERMARSVRKRLGLENIVTNIEQSIQRGFNFDESHKLQTVYLNSLPRIGRTDSARTYGLAIEARPHAFNPALASTRSGWLSIVRDTSMVVVNDGEQYVYTGLPHRTENYCLSLNGDFELQSSVKVQFPVGADSPSPNGLEDIRLLNHGDSIFGIGAGIKIGSDRSDRKITQIAFAMSVEGVVESFTPIKSPFGYSVEKNWMPFVHNGKVHIVYSVTPLVVFCLEDGALAPVRGDVQNGTVQHSGFRYAGSTNGVPFGGGFLFVVHKRETYGSKISFTHFFMYLDSKLELLQISEPFLFERPGIEFAVNLVCDAGDIVISYGVADRKAKVIRVKSDIIADMLAV